MGSKSPDLAALRDGGALLVETLATVAKAVAVGVTTKELDRIAESGIRAGGAVPAFLGHQGFAASLCTSINSQVVHGIPGSYQLADGDIISLDLGVKLGGWFTDAAITVPVGRISSPAARLLQATRRSLEVALTQATAGRTTGDLGAAVQGYIEGEGLAVVRDCVGHGIGTQLHQDPSIPNFGTPGQGTTFRSGLVVAIEPMVVTGGPETEVADDRWTISTRDGSLAAHYEETVVITDGAPERLTPLPEAVSPDSLSRLVTPDKLNQAVLDEPSRAERGTT